MVEAIVTIVYNATDRGLNYTVTEVHRVEFESREDAMHWLSRANDTAVSIEQLKADN